ncbi:MAG: hypothetical protein AB1454_14385 [Candidatus Auribacterota bacterium]
MMRTGKYILNYLMTIAFCFCYAGIGGFADENNIQQLEQTPPLVLSIPGFLVPGSKMTQEQHFGNLQEIFADLSIPYQCMVYDSKDNPLSVKSGLITEKYSVLSTRVIPDILLSIQKERMRRETNNLPPLKEVVLIGYSQGGLITLQFVGRNYNYRKQYDEYKQEFGGEYQALMNDPVYKELVLAVGIYQKILDAAYQHEAEFSNNKDLQDVKGWLELEVKRRFEILKNYIMDPVSVFPTTQHFDSPETDKYPKKYNSLKTYLLKKQDDPEFLNHLNEFIVEDAFFGPLRDIEFRTICISGSIFGSPKANVGYEMLYRAPMFKPMVKGIEQIKDTRLGSPQHTKAIERLVDFDNDSEYPLNDKNILFIIGANDEKGDDFVEQPCGHLSGHQYAEIDLASYRGMHQDKDKPVYIKKSSIPDLPVVPLEVHHFPVKTFFGLGPELSGSAYIDSVGHPSFKYIKAFIEQDFASLEEYKRSNQTFVRQFMVEITLGKVERIKEKLRELNLNNDTAGISKLLKSLEVSIELVNRPADIHIQSKYLNKENFTYIFIGSFEEDKIVFFKEDLDITQEYPLDFIINVKEYPPLYVTLPVRPGEITFLKIFDSDHEMQDVKR